MARKYEDDEIKQIITYLDNEGQNASSEKKRVRLLGIKTLFLWGINTGCRISESLSLTVKDIWHKKDVLREVKISRKNTKGKNDTHIYEINNNLRSIIRDLIGKIGTENHLKLFPKTVRCYQKAFERIHSKLGFDRGLSTHSMRKTLAEKIWDASDKDLIAVQKGLNHRRIDSTQHYLKGKDVKVVRKMITELDLGFFNKACNTGVSSEKVEEIKNVDESINKTEAPIS
jgi:integrase